MWQKLILFVNTTRFKTTLWYSLLFLLLELLLGGIVYYQFSSTLHSNLDRSLTRLAQNILKTVTEKKLEFEKFIPDSTFRDPEEYAWDIIFDDVAYTRRNFFIQISFGQKLIFKSASLYEHYLSFPDKKDKYNLFEFRDSTLSLKKIRAVKLNQDNFRVIVAFPKEHIDENLAGILETYKFFFPLFLIISIAGGAVISHRSLSRIDAIIKKTEEITAHKLDEKISGEEHSDEYGRLVKKMNEMISRIKTSIDYMNQFSISAAHELKTPLTILRGEIEIALKSPKTSDQYIEVLKSSYEETMRLIKIVDNLFFISKIDHDMITIHPEPVKVDDFLRGVANNLRMLGHDKKIDIILESSTKKTVLIDRDLMMQAISNLLDNAIKYGQEWEPVYLTSSIKNGRIKIDVINRGESIPVEQNEKIFDRFYRLEGSRNRKTGGVGLGLSVVKAITDWHNADIEIECLPNNTTRFTIYLEYV